MENQQIAAALAQISEHLVLADKRQAEAEIRRAEDIKILAGKVETVTQDNKILVSKVETVTQDNKILVSKVETVTQDNKILVAKIDNVTKENRQLALEIREVRQENKELKEELVKVNNNLLLIRKDLLMIGDRVVEVFEGISDELRKEINQDLINLQSEGMTELVDDLKQSKQFKFTNESKTCGVYKATKQQRRHGIIKSIYDIYSAETLLRDMIKERVNGVKFLNRFLDKSFGVRFQNGIHNTFIPVTKNVLTYYHYDRTSGLK